MNSKRWIAIVISIAVILVMGSASVFKIKKEQQSMDAFTESFNSLFMSKETDSVIEVGDKQNRIMVIRIEGVISSSPSYSGGYNHQLTLDALDKAYNDNSVKGVILSVNSPGGAVYESAEIKDKVRLLNEDKKIPVYAVFGSMAASGGYYVSAYADKIYAGEETWTGSIGVIMSSMEMSGLMDKLGIKSVVIKSAEHKDIMSSYRPMTNEEKGYMQDLVDSAFNRFVKVVSEGRNLSEAEVRKFADGRIFDGDMAKEIGLVDNIGKMENAIIDMKEALGIENSEIFELTMPLGRWNMLFPGFMNIKSEIGDLREIYSDFSRPKLMYIYGE